MTITDLLTDRAIPHHTEGKDTRPGWINLRCPYCQKDPYLGFNLQRSYFHCWSCGGHSRTHTLSLLTGLTLKECWDFFASYQSEEHISLRKHHIGRLIYPFGVGALGEPHKRYIQERGFSPREVVCQWDVQGISQGGGPLRWRLFLPIYLNGEVVSWTTRSIKEDNPLRYWSAKDDQSSVPITHLIYGIDACRNTIILCEGPFDAWAIGVGGCALLGQRVSASQLDQISKYPIRVVCFDRENLAQKRARKLCKDLSTFPGQTHCVVLESGKDPGESNKSEIKELRERFLENPGE